MHRALVPGLAAALLLAPVPTGGGVIRGVVRAPAALSQEVRASDPYPGRANALAGVRPPVRGAAIDAVVYVESVPAAAESALARRPSPASFAQKDQAFLPRVLAVAAGTQVDFPNLDPIYHNVFSLSPAKRFDLGKYPRGRSKQVRFDKTGLVNVYCDIHSSMEGFVLVLPHHGFARPNAAGEFALPDLPAGRYQLRVWHPDLAEITRAVDLPDTGSVTVELTY